LRYSDIMANTMELTITGIESIENQLTLLKDQVQAGNYETMDKIMVDQFVVLHGIGMTFTTRAANTTDPRVADSYLKSAMKAFNASKDVALVLKKYAQPTDSD